MIENKSWKNPNYKLQTIMKSKYQTNNLIIFLILFGVQVLLIYLSENVIYSFLKSENKLNSTNKRHRRKKRNPPRDTVISDEQDLFLNFGNNMLNEDIENSNDKSKFPKL
jgi:hypothetical protein